MKGWWKWLLPLLILGALGFWISRQFTTTVLIAEAESGTAVNAVTGTVEVLAFADIHVKAQNRGEIVEVLVEAGDAIEEGDLIARQSSEELELRLEQVNIRLEAAEARSGLESTHKIDLESLEDRREDVKLSVDLGQAPASQLEEVDRQRRKKEVLWKTEKIQERENLRLLRNQVEQLELQRGQMRTRAPFDGIVAELNAFKGDLVNPSQNLIRLVAHGRYIMMELTEEDYFGVEDGQEVTLRLASYPDRTFAGTVTRLSDVANANNKTRNVFVEVEAAQDVMVPGLTGEGYLVKAERENAVLVPRRALIGNLIYVFKNGRVEKRKVRPGFLSLNKAEIREGLEPGERVIVEDQNLLADGQRVEAEPLTQP
jgi:RND family efflux transporter MFP subunit